MSRPNPWKILSTKIVYQNPWIRIHEDKVVTPLGNEGIYGYMESNDSVNIVVANEQREIYLVNTFRYTDKSWNWELPGGGGDKQEAVEASKRELEEETGIRARTWEKLGKTHVCNGLMTEKMSTYLARDLSFDGEKEVADEQVVDGRFCSLDEVHTMIDRDDINDCQNMTSIYLYERWLAKPQGTSKEEQ